MNSHPLPVPAALPDPATMPAIGPVLSLYLKARALKAGAGRLMLGADPITPEAREPARRALERMLGGR